MIKIIYIKIQKSNVDYIKKALFFNNALTTSVDPEDFDCW